MPINPLLSPHHHHHPAAVKTIPSSSPDSHSALFPPPPAHPRVSGSHSLACISLLSKLLEELVLVGEPGTGGGCHHAPGLLLLVPARKGKRRKGGCRRGGKDERAKALLLLLLPRTALALAPSWQLLLTFRLACLFAGKGRGGLLLLLLLLRSSFFPSPPPSFISSKKLGGAAYRKGAIRKAKPRKAGSRRAGSRSGGGGLIQSGYRRWESVESDSAAFSQAASPSCWPSYWAASVLPPRRFPSPTASEALVPRDLSPRSLAPWTLDGSLALERRLAELLPALASSGSRRLGGSPGCLSYSHCTTPPSSDGWTVLLPGWAKQRCLTSRITPPPAPLNEPLLHQSQQNEDALR